MNKVLLTGGSGFIGSHLITKLKSENCDVACMGRTVVDSCDNFIVNDVTDINEIREIVNTVRPDYLFHLAGSVCSDFQDALRINAILGHNILESISLSGLDTKTKILFVGSAAEYGLVSQANMPVTEITATQPYSSYGISKLASTLNAVSWSNQKRHLSVVRPFTVIGSGMPTYLAVGNFINQITHGYDGMTLKTGNLDSARDFIDIEDVVDIFWKLVNNHESSGQVFNLYSGSPITISEILEYIIYKVKIDINIETSDSLLRKIDMPIHYGSNKKLVELIGPMKFISWKESIDKIVAKL